MRRFIIALSRLALFGIVMAILAGAALVYVLDGYRQDLPDYQRLVNYEPSTVTRIHAGDGRLLAEYARQRRVFVPFEAIPEPVRKAFVSAEDQNFWTHPGLDLKGIVRAAIDNIERLQNNQRPQGASTITQQVAKNFLLTNEISVERKVKEAILAMRIEGALSKEDILELYLNEIFLGRRSYGVAAAALNYFDKSLNELTIAETAFIAGLPKAPSAYDPERNMSAALERRDYVITRMLDDGHITPEQAAEARAEPIELKRRSPETFVEAPFFTEEVRRQLVARYGDAGFYEGGLSVRTTIDSEIQYAADIALHDGLADYDRRVRGWRGALGTLEPAEGGDIADPAVWPPLLDAFDPGFELFTWRKAAVIGLGADRLTLGFVDGSTGDLMLEDMSWARVELADDQFGPALQSPGDILSVGDVIAVEDVGEQGVPRYGLRQRPSVDGAIVALNPHTGQVLALSGGFSYRQSQFNRATQALRQPGSAFKPFVYMAALEQGFTPATIVLDAPIEIDQGEGLPPWRPENYTERFYGPSTLRLGLEKSRNLMTVRLAQQVGMERVVDLARRFGIGDRMEPLLAASLGSIEVTAIDLTRAYGMIVNGGKTIDPYLIEQVQDRNGKTIFRRDQRHCPGCNGAPYTGAPPPDLADNRTQATDPRIAYQLVSMMQGVIQRGTAVRAASLGLPLAGKTGTTNEARDAWFVGFSPDLVVGVFVGFDQPSPLGRQETGGSVALPIWIKVMEDALADQPAAPFRTPPGLELVQIDAKTGLLPGPDTETTIVEPFLPGTEPSASIAGFDALPGAPQARDGTVQGDDGGERPPARRVTAPVSAGGVY